MCMLLLGISLAVHDIGSAQGLSENIEILSALSRRDLDSTSVTQGPHKVPHR